MKLIFAGPSLHGSKQGISKEIALRPPAAKGDVFRAVDEGASVIGLVDGYFETTSAVWHKEILIALSQGVRVFGAASIGALRAAECAAFGMVGIGTIYQGFASGELEDDSEVALLHAPPELGYCPLSLPMVNVRATLSRLERAGRMDEPVRDLLVRSASAIFYKERTWKAIFARAGLDCNDIARWGALVQEFHVDAKRADAEALIRAVDSAPGERSGDRPPWTLSQTSFLQLLGIQQ